MNVRASVVGALVLASYAVVADTKPEPVLVRPNAELYPVAVGKTLERRQTNTVIYLTRNCPMHIHGAEDMYYSEVPMMSGTPIEWGCTALFLGYKFQTISPGGHAVSDNLGFFELALFDSKTGTFRITDMSARKVIEALQ